MTYRAPNPDKHKVSPVILYEYPFSERIRTYLRLEHLLRRLQILARKESPLDHHGALAALFELLEVASRAEIKSDLIKDLERQRQVIESYRGLAGVEESLLQQALDRLQPALLGLQNMNGRFGQALFSHPFLGSLRSRFTIPAGTCAFDVPAYCAWQQEAPAERQRHLQLWLSDLKPMSQPIAILLGLLRDSAKPVMVMANRGQYEQTLPNTRNYLLLRVGLPEKLRLVPEISCNRLFVSIRLQRLGDEGVTHLCSDDMPLEMTLCA